MFFCYSQKMVQSYKNKSEKRKVKSEKNAFCKLFSLLTFLFLDF